MRAACRRWQITSMATTDKAANRPNKIWLFAIAAIVAVSSGVLAARWLGAARVVPPPEIGGYVVDKQRPLPPFMLLDETGAPFAPAALEGHWSFLYFGYTYCPDVCPLSLVELANVKKQLAAIAPEDTAQYYLVSIDPARDTPARLKEYVAYFDPGFHGLTGDAAEIAKLAQAAGTIFFVPEGQGSENYLVSHTSNIVVLDPTARVHAVFSTPHTADQVAADFVKIAARYRALHGPR
jgi:protein SCO1/2